MLVTSEPKGEASGMLATGQTGASYALLMTTDIGSERNKKFAPGAK